MPSDEHALAAAIPTWEQVKAFAEGVLPMGSGYPRFVRHRDYKRLCERYGGAVRGAVWIVPSERVAKACLNFLEGEGQLSEAPDGLYKVAVDNPFVADAAKAFWQHTGLVVSSRRAADMLDNVPAPDGRAAKAEIRERIAKLAGVQAGDVLLYPSGMAAMFNLHSMLRERAPRLRTLQIGFPYVDTQKVQLKFGEGVRELAYSSKEDLARLDKILESEQFAAAFCDLPGNPLLRTVDFAGLKERLVEHGTPLVVDDTIGTWKNIDVREHADVTFTSLSKFFSGEGNVLAGCISLNPASGYYVELSQRLHESYEDLLYAGDAVVLADNSRDFDERMEIFNANAIGLVEFLRRRTAVKAVYYPDETNREEYEAIRKKDGGFGGLFTVELDDPLDAARVYDALRLCKGAGLGTNFTLVSPYTMLAHYSELGRVEKSGVLPHQLRVSAGLEPLEFICEHFDRALPG